MEEEEAPRGLTTLGRPRAGLMIEERSRLNDPCPRVLDSPWIGPRFAVESERTPRYRLPKTPAVGVAAPIFAPAKTEVREIEDQRCDASRSGCIAAKNHERLAKFERTYKTSAYYSASFNGIPIISYVYR